MEHENISDGNRNKMSVIMHRAQCMIDTNRLRLQLSLRNHYVSTKLINQSISLKGM